MAGDRRREIRAIVEAYVGAPDLHRIAGQVRAMARLWPNTRGLRRRREAEAALIESAA